MTVKSDVHCVQPDLQNIKRLSYDNAVITIDLFRYDSLAKL